MGYRLRVIRLARLVKGGSELVDEVPWAAWAAVGYGIFLSESDRYRAEEASAGRMVLHGRGSFP